MKIFINFGILFLNQHFECEHNPRIVEFINVLPRTAVGKIFRRKLREKAVEKHEKEKSFSPL